MDKQVFFLVHEQARENAIEAVRAAPEGSAVTIQDKTRTLEQNAAQWPYLTGFSRQLQWPVNGKMERLSRDEWKDILTAAFEQDTRMRLAQSLDGAWVVMLGRRTRDYGKNKFSEWIEFLKATAVDRGVEPVFARDRGRK